MALDTAKIPIASLSVYQQETQDLILDFKKSFIGNNINKLLMLKQQRPLSFQKDTEKFQKKAQIRKRVVEYWKIY